MGINFETAFQSTLNVVKDVLTQVVVEGASKNPRVQSEIKKAETKIVKESWWKIAPFVVIGGGLFLLIKTLK